MARHICDVCGKDYKYKRNLKRHKSERHGESLYWNCVVKGCETKFIRRGYLCVHLTKIHGFDRCTARESALIAIRGDKPNEDYQYYQTISDDDSILDMLAEKDEMMLHTGQDGVSERRENNDCGNDNVDDVDKVSVGDNMDKFDDDNVTDSVNAGDTMGVNDVNAGDTMDGGNVDDTMADGENVDDTMADDDGNVDVDDVIDEDDDEYNMNDTVRDADVVNGSDKLDSNGYSDISDDDIEILDDLTVDKSDRSVRVVTEYFNITAEKKYYYRGDELIDIQQYVYSDRYWKSE